jgi:molybdopterin-biosynthesis enzyme MoeA-like protein
VKEKMMVATADKQSKGLPTAQEVMEKLALAEAEKASVEARKHAAAEAEKKALIDKLTKPSGVSDEDALKRVATIVDRAVANGLTEVQVYRFPNTLCTDNGRAINQQETGWETTLTGVPKEMYEFWDRQLRPLGYKLRVQRLDCSRGAQLSRLAVTSTFRGQLNHLTDSLTKSNSTLKEPG